MYKNFFGFKERPFKLVPNPAYLFLSRSHEEALAHLTYAVIQGEGFMEITGEVGTGKTTLCRAFLEHLDDDTTSAYIFNTNLSSIELLKAINDEFGIPSDADNPKDLIDTLNAFLIEQKAQGKNTILLIDEAQNLTNEVLELLRLLSNLETAKHKLLYIILVGQPELKEKLNSHELRQLKQRISLSCRLIPLELKDVRNYIQHRIYVASGEPRVQFADAAYRSIYNYSRGIPRLVNIVCDRALLTAFSLDQKEITQGIVKASINELTDRNNIKESSFGERKKTILSFSIVSLILLMIFYFSPGLFRTNTIDKSPETKKLDTPHSNNVKKPASVITAPDVKKSVTSVGSDVKENPAPPVTVSESKKMIQTETASESKKPVSIAIASESERIEEQKVKAHEPVMVAISEPVRNLGSLLGTMNRRSSRHMAIKVALNLWDIEPEIKSDLDAINDDLNFFELVSKENNLLIRRINGNLNAIKKLNLPVILTVHLNKGVPPLYLALIKIDAQKITIRGGKQDVSIEVSPVELEPYWSGEAYVPWKNFLSLKGIIPINCPKNSIVTLKMFLRDIGFKEIKINPFYDDKTRQAIKEIQKKYGLNIDGAVGSTTKIALYNEKKIFKRPHIFNAANSFVR
jgi:general secretion pathway protein A